MVHPHEIEDHINLVKLTQSEESQLRLRQQNLNLLNELKLKEQLLQRLKSESDMNARALKKFDEENQRLALALQKLLTDCHNLETEISLYESDREALMELGNDADEREQEAQSMVLDLERKLLVLMDELNKYKHRHDLMVDSSSTCTSGEKRLLESLLATLTSEDDDSAVVAFLEVNSETESCKKLLSMWNRLKTPTQKVLSLVAKVKSLQNAKEHLRTNLHKAEEEVKLLYGENLILDENNKRLFSQYKERNHTISAGKHTDSASAQSNKRKSSPRTSSPVERKIDFGDLDSARQQLSPLQINSPECRIYKK